ncbi:MAG: adenylate/guanylate cyclase domain-containing protein [Rhizobiales bacterium]|nr:adenylate/guanylate cyclase domain-containing protein [Hyphomicrobiales bacterium]
MTPRSLRRKLLKIVVSAIILAAIGTPLFVLRGADQERALTGLLIFGIALGSIEEFYLRSPRGAWIREGHPLLAISATFVFAILTACAAVIVNLALWGELELSGPMIHALFRHLPLVALMVATLAIVLRVIGFVGGRTLFHLLTGRYHRPVAEKQVLAFIDIRNSTSLVEDLGALRGKEAISHVVTLVSRSVIEHGGDIYLYTGDGMIANWDWKAATRGQAILEFARDALRAVRDDEPYRLKKFGVAMDGIRIGIAGGDVVVSEQGDIRRAIGIWGDAINVASRLEQAGKELREDCLIAQPVLNAMDIKGFELVTMPPIAVRGIREPVLACALRA